MISNSSSIYNQISFEKEISVWVDYTNKITFDSAKFEHFGGVKLLYNEFLKLYCFKFIAELKNLTTNDNTFRKIADFNDIIFNDEFSANNECIAFEPNLTSYNKVILNIRTDGIYYKRAMSTSNWYEITNNLFIPAK